MSDIKVLALVGSLRAASVNRQIAELAAETAPTAMSVTVYEVSVAALAAALLQRGHRQPGRRTRVGDQAAQRRR